MFKLYTTKQITNMWLFNQHQQLKKYKTIAAIIDAYIPVRLETYEKRIAYLIKELEREVKILHNKSRFIQEQCDDVIDLRRKKKQIVIDLLQSRSYDVIDEDEDYKYLRGMRIEEVEEENMKKLEDRLLEIQSEYTLLQSTTVGQMWLREIKAFEKQYAIYIKGRVERIEGVKIKKKKKKIKINKNVKQ